MRVFISWSGEPSRSIARALADWLKGVLPQVNSWMSDQIRSGERWRIELDEWLEETNFGIICITRSNQREEWVMYEAGALGKYVKTAKVVPLCIDLAPSDITGPLSAFQGRQLDKSGVERLIHDLNQATEKPMQKDRLEQIFESSWPDLESDIAEAPKSVPLPPEPQPSERSMLSEILKAVPRIERDRPQTVPTNAPIGYIGDGRRRDRYAPDLVVGRRNSKPRPAPAANTDQPVVKRPPSYGA